jgi:serine/threonine-protein kinase
MTDDTRVQQLLDQLLDSDVTPEVVCGSCPELLPVVRNRWRQIRRLQGDLNALFPPPNELPPRPSEGMALPQIPGYEVESILGRGGMGIVYKARHLRLNRPVALKMLLAGAYAGPEQRHRFLREAEAVAGLRHANIVQVHDMGDHDGRPYFTMEYVEGGTLAEKLRGTPQCVGDAAGLVATLAGAVQAAHQGGIVHRDLKPANILLQGNSEIRNLKSENETLSGSDFGFRISDFTPKIADFGLARHFEGESALTLSGARVGTPSYMAPEQASGQTHTVGPAVDIYALGAVLYELLTGRPPFRGATPAETELQVVHLDPVPPTRLNPSVPRDLETICLKCLEKDPQRRYATAASLAEDLHRFQCGEPIAARRPGTLERLGRWVRRRPTVGALLAATLLFTIALTGGALWLSVRHAELRRAVEGDLKEVAVLQQEARWTDAGGALQKAEARLRAGGLGDGDLRQAIDAARRDLDLVIELDRIRLSRATSSRTLPYYQSRADRQYVTAFENAGLVKAQDAPDLVAARVNASAVRVALLSALDDWAVCATDKSHRDWLLTIARLTDRDQLGWSDRIRESATWDDRAVLTQLAETVPVSGQSVSLLLALGERLGAAGGDATSFLKRVQKDHPADFWANLVLGDALFRTEPLEAASFYRSALASRPGAAVAYTALGDSLRAQKRRDEALGYYRQALDIDPNYPRGHTNLGNFLREAGEIDEAIACYHRALTSDPNYVWAHFDLATTLSNVGRHEEAIEHYRQFHAINPALPHVANILRSALIREGRGEEARREWKKALQLNPPKHAAWFGYAEMCLFLGNQDEYQRARQDLLRRFSDTSDPYVAEPTARAALLAPASEEELRIATALADRAVAANPTTNEWVYPYFLFAKGLAEYRQGHFDSAISIMNGKAAKVLGPCPRLVMAMATYRLGREQEARKTLAAVIGTVDWSMAGVRSHDQWLWHILRREAESLILPNLRAFLDGTYQPQDNDERLAFLGACQFQNRTAAMARLYADAFAAAPSLAEDLGSGHRYHAACAAAQAGCGHGADAAGLGDDARARWREHARQWLRAELAARARALNEGSTATRGAHRLALTRWRTEAELACVRDPAELDKLAAGEQKEYLALWAELAAVLAHTEQ